MTYALGGEGCQSVRASCVHFRFSYTSKVVTFFHRTMKPQIDPERLGVKSSERSSSSSSSCSSTAPETPSLAGSVVTGGVKPYVKKRTRVRKLEGTIQINLNLEAQEEETAVTIPVKTDAGTLQTSEKSSTSDAHSGSKISMTVRERLKAGLPLFTCC